jgi:signal transduction histidine kinase
MLSAPLIGKNGPLGILRVYSNERDHFTSDDEIFLEAIAAQGSVAIDNALAYKAIEELDATKSTFIRMVTHELRSPVSVTRSLLRTITAGYTGDVNEQQRDILERATRRIDFLQKLIDDLLELAAGKVEIKISDEIAPIILDEVLQRVIKRYEVSAKEKDIDLKFQSQLREGSTIVMATSEGLDRIFNNLISNAVKYTLPGGSVLVNLQHMGKEAWITVKDTGIGIPEDALGHLFEEFFRASNAKELVREGTGLGLTIVKDSVTRFGGRVSVQSKLREGTLFTVMLPLKGKAQPVIEAELPQPMSK